MILTSLPPFGELFDARGGPGGRSVCSGFVSSPSIIGKNTLRRFLGGDSYPAHTRKCVDCTDAYGCRESERQAAPATGKDLDDAVPPTMIELLNESRLVSV